MGLAPLLLVPVARAAASLEMSGNLVLIGDPTIRGSFEARAIGDPTLLVGTGKFETPTMTILFSFTGNIIGDPNARAVVTISGAVTQSNDPALAGEQLWHDPPFSLIFWNPKLNSKFPSL